MAYLFLGEPLGFDGATPALGASSLAMPDATHAAILNDYQSAFLNVVGTLTAARAVNAMPLVAGASIRVRNVTAGGFAITIGGSTGTSVTVPNGATVTCVCNDGANWEQGTTSASSLLSSGGGASILPLTAVGVLWLPGPTSPWQAETEGLFVQTTNATPTLVGTIVIPNNQGIRIDVSLKTSLVGSDFMVNDHVFTVTNVSGTVAIPDHADGTAVGTATGKTWPGCTMVLGSGASVNLMVTGVAATTIGWDVAVDITFGN